MADRQIEEAVSPRRDLGDNLIGRRETVAEFNLAARVIPVGEEHHNLGIALKQATQLALAQRASNLDPEAFEQREEGPGR